MTDFWSVLQICYTKADHRKSVKQHRARRAFDDRVRLRSMLGYNSSDKGRAISENQAQENLQQGHKADFSCPDFLVFIGTRGSLLQVLPQRRHLPGKPSEIPHNVLAN